MARTALITESDPDGDEGGDYVAPGPENANGLANIGEMAPPSDGRPDSNRDRNEFTIIETDNDGRPLQQRTSTEAPLDDEHAGDGTYIERQRRHDERQANTPERRAERRARQKEGKERTLAENQQMKAELAELRARIQGFEPRLNEFDQGRIQQQIGDMERQIAAAAAAKNAAYQRIGEATIAGDTQAMARAMEERDNAFVQEQRLTAHKDALAARIGQTQQGNARPDVQEVRAPAPPPRVVQERISQFQEQNPWFNPDPVDRYGRPIPETAETRVMKAIDQSVADDGYNPATQDYWDELEDRARQFLPQRFGRQAQERPRDDYDEPPRQQQRPAAPAPQQRRGPPVAGNSDRAPTGRGNTVYLSPERKEALIMAGALGRDGKTVENPERFQRYLKQYANYDAQNGRGA